MTMTPQDIQRLHHWASTSLSPDTNPALILAMGADKTEAAAFLNFYREFRDQAPGVHFKREEEHVSQLPTLLVGGHQNIAFHLIPTGKWLGFFLDAIAPPDMGKQSMAGPFEAQLKQLHLPVALKLFVSHQCPHCPLVITQLLPMAQANARVHLDIIDTNQFPEAVQREQLRAVPALIMEDQFRWIGSIDAHEILDMAIRRDPATLSPASLRQLLEAGQARQAAEMMVATDTVFDALIELLVDEKWPVRLAAMVVVEHLAEQTPQLADTIIAPLWGRFHQCPVAVKGDLAYVLGVIHTDMAKEKLHCIAKEDADPQVKEAAKEALMEDHETSPN